MKTKMKTKMKEWKVVWTQAPVALHTAHVTFIEAETAEDATTLVNDFIRRKHGIDWFWTEEPKETTPLPAGRILGA